MIWFNWSWHQLFPPRFDDYKFNELESGKFFLDGSLQYNAARICRRIARDNIVPTLIHPFEGYGVHDGDASTCNAPQCRLWKCRATLNRRNVCAILDTARFPLYSHNTDVIPHVTPTIINIRTSAMKSFPRYTMIDKSSLTKTAILHFRLALTNILLHFSIYFFTINVIFGKLFFYLKINLYKIIKY